MKQIIVFLCTIIFTHSIYAWNALGHMVIANIAYQQLSAVAKQKVDIMVRELNKEYIEVKTLMDMAAWPDGLRSQKIEIYTHWHYIDNPIALDHMAVHPPLDTDNAIWAMQKIQPIVQNNKANTYERARFLAFLTHIVGDLHQPLHTVSSYSFMTPEGDKGGNLYKIRYNGKPSNLHRFWDKGAGSLVGIPSISRAEILATTLQANFPPTYFGKKVNDLNAEIWMKEGMLLAQDFIYLTPYSKPLSAEYIKRSQQLSAEQITLAGYRLGHLLNQLL